MRQIESNRARPCSCAPAKVVAQGKKVLASVHPIGYE